MNNKNSASLAVMKRRKYLKELAVQYKGGKCRNCGYDNYIGALEFHHVNPKIKEMNFGNGECRSWERMKKELDKCVLLCVNCHRETENGYFSCEGMERFNVEVRDEKETKVRQIKYCFDCKIETHLKSKRCLSCDLTYRRKSAKVTDRPTKKQLVQMLSKEKKSFTKIAEEYGVSDNAVRKWCKSEGLPYRVSDWKQYKIEKEKI